MKINNLGGVKASFNIKQMNKEEAIKLLIQVAVVAQAKGMFTFEESEAVHAAVKMLKTENVETTPTEEV